MAELFNPICGEFGEKCFADGVAQKESEKFGWRRVSGKE